MSMNDNHLGAAASGQFDEYRSWLGRGAERQLLLTWERENHFPQRFRVAPVGTTIADPTWGVKLITEEAFDAVGLAIADRDTGALDTYFDEVLEALIRFGSGTVDGALYVDELRSAEDLYAIALYAINPSTDQ